MIPNSQSANESLNEWFGAMDMYVLDQIRKGNMHPAMRVLDAGCGHGRNIQYFLKAGAEVYAFDTNAEYIEAMKESADQLQPGINPAQFKHADGEKIPFDDNQFDAVLSSAVLHFARDKAHFDAMLQELVRVLAPGGLLLIRTAWQPANEVTVQPLGNDHFLHPDGMDYFIAPYSVDDFCAKLNELGITLTESAKVTQVHRLRAMSTFVGMKE